MIRIFFSVARCFGFPVNNKLDALAVADEIISMSIFGGQKWA